MARSRDGKDILCSHDQGASGPHSSELFMYTLATPRRAQMASEVMCPTTCPRPDHRQAKSEHRTASSICPALASCILHLASCIFRARVPGRDRPGIVSQEAFPVSPGALLADTWFTPGVSSPHVSTGSKTGQGKTVRRRMRLVGLGRCHHSAAIRVSWVGAAVGTMSANLSTQISCPRLCLPLLRH